jgi:DNA-binding MarR family transcriptional regulator
VVAGADDELNDEFFATLGAYIQSSRVDGHPERASQLETLRGQLLELSTYGRELAARMLAGPEERPALSREELLEKMLAASTEEELAEQVAWYRGTVDYAFFQMLTERLEAADRAGQAESAGRLRDLRSTLLAVTERMDQEAQEALEKATGLLKELLNAEDAPALVRARLNEFDDAFFIVLGANLKAADAAGRPDARERLQQLGNLVLEIAQEKLPPEVRLIRRLMAAEDDDIASLLQEHEALVDENLALLIRDLAGDVEEEGAEVRLKHLAERVEEWLRGRQG